MDLQTPLTILPSATAWQFLPNYQLHGVGRPAALIVVTHNAVLVIDHTTRAQVAAMALDLADFHAGCRNVPVLPVWVTPTARAGTHPIPFPGVADVQETTLALLPGLLQEITTRFPPCAIDVAGWAGAPYRPVPGLMAAACLLYARHDVLALAQGSAGPDGVRRTSRAIQAAVQDALAIGQKRVVFVTGAPGAGKTLCGLDVAFTPGLGAAYMTGNPTLVHVLRAALLQDAVARGRDRRAVAQQLGAVIQALPTFRDASLAAATAPAPRVVVIDEAQRCWTETHAIGKTRNTARPLTMSEPAHVLDAMARHAGAAVVVCLLGGGQEIHAGEGGLAAWGEALAARPAWDVLAPSTALDHPDPRQRLMPGPCLRTRPDLNLATPIRALHRPREGAWVDAVLAGDAGAARAIAAQHGAPRLTRSLHTLRKALCRAGPSRGLIASSGARRLRAEGLGSVLPHQDADAVQRWFLAGWPDIRSAAALETAATEFSVQGLELDYAGLCWDADLVWCDGFIARQFRGSAWTTLHSADAQSNRRNAYRVLLTRSRRGTVIWMPRGDASDPTRAPALYDGTAAYLIGCGALVEEEGDSASSVVISTVPRGTDGAWDQSAPDPLGPAVPDLDLFRPSLPGFGMAIAPS